MFGQHLLKQGSFVMMGPGGTGKSKIMVEMLTTQKWGTAIIACPNNVVVKHWKKLLKEAGIKGFLVITLHAAIGAWPSGKIESAAQLGMMILGHEVHSPSPLAAMLEAEDRRQITDVTPRVQCVVRAISNFDWRECDGSNGRFRIYYMDAAHHLLPAAGEK